MPTPMAPPSRVPLFLSLLVAFHIAIVIASNYLVQLPITLLGFHSTWGAFSFPFIFLATDLTVRLVGKGPARRVIAWAMVPALVASYIVGVLCHDGHFNGVGALGAFNTFGPKLFYIPLPPALIPAAMALATVAGVVAAAVPASRAARLDPVEAIRHA